MHVRVAVRQTEIVVYVMPNVAAFPVKACPPGGLEAQRSKVPKTDLARCWNQWHEE